MQKALSILQRLEYFDINEVSFDELMEAKDELENFNGKDNLAELEAHIREWFIKNDKAPGYECDSWFELQIGSMYRQKYLSVFDITSIHHREHIVTATGRTTKEIFDKAFRFFTCKKM